MIRGRVLILGCSRGANSFHRHPQFPVPEGVHLGTAPGLNCLIGPGDAGKSSVLDAIDYCLGARRSISFSDADFHSLDVSEPITITITIGELEDALKSMETYGQYLFNPETNAIDDEPETGRETVLTLRLTVKNDLEPLWTLVSDRADAQGQARFRADIEAVTETKPEECKSNAGRKPQDSQPGGGTRTCASRIKGAPDRRLKPR
jgi:AAA domain, putative AbiEii toxin, Type IV TA system